MAITVPKEHESGLARILNLSNEQTEQVATALRQAKSINLAELRSLVEKALPSFPPDQIAEIVSTLVSLFSARISADAPLDAFVTDLLAAAKPANRSNEIRANVKALLSVNPLSMMAKARGVHTDYENTFCKVRILTELRPVFDIDVKQDPVGFVMAHVLKIGYHREGRHTSIRIAIDKKDIDALMQTLERAKDKAETLSDLTEKCGYKILAE